MSTKRLLFIQDDPFLGSLYRERLESAGFTVETARSSEAGLRILRSMKPDAVVLDPVLPDGDIGESIESFRSQESVSGMPILVLPTFHTALANSAEKAGATKLLERTANPLTALVNEIAGALGVKPPSGTNGHGPEHLDTHWHRAALSAAPGSLQSLRQSLHDVMRVPDSPDTWRDLLQRSHAFAGQMAVLGENPVSHLASALEVLVFGLVCCPQRITASSLRSIGQGVDFLATMLELGAQLKPLELEGSHALIVEDEASAREMIAAAMELVGISAGGLETPAASLAVLSTQPCDLIFLDINLPEMNGFEICGKVRELPLHEKTPIVFLTGMASFHNRVQSSLSGGNDFVGKPFNLAELGVKALIWIFRSRYGLM